MIANLTCGMEPCGKGYVVVARWTKNGKHDHLSTLGNASTVEAFRNEMETRLGLRQQAQDTPFIEAVKAGKVSGLKWR